MDWKIRKMTSEDWEEVRRIFVQGIETNSATFETEPPDWQAWDRAHIPEGRRVAEGPVGLAGWVALSAVSDRCCYQGVVEVSIYLEEDSRGKGLGRVLLEEVIQEAEDQGIWTLQAGIFPENEASLALHYRCGFRLVGRRERLGRLEGEWKDVLLLERRREGD